MDSCYIISINLRKLKRYQMKFQGINHVAFATHDMDTTIIFWRDLMGLRLVAGIGDKKSRQYFFEIAHNCMISFFEWPDVQPMPDKNPGSPVEGPFGFDHICLEVASQDELWHIKNTLEGADIWCSELLDNGFIYSVFSTDPNNIQLELCCRVKEVNISEKPLMKDPDASAIAQEGPDQHSDKWPSSYEITPKDQRRVYPGPLKRLVE